MLNNKSHNTNPALTPNTHLLVAGIIGLISFFLFIIVWESIVSYFLPDNWNKTLVMMISFLVIVPIPVFIFDALVSARCPKCDGEMFGSSFRPPYKECKKCQYRYEYSIFGNN
jgi:hypothetical protein